MFSLSNAHATLGERAGQLVLHRVLPIVFLLPLAGGATAEVPPTDTDVEPQAVVSDRVTVTDSRLRDRPADGESVAAHVTVLDREAIESAGAINPQELLALEAGVILFDATGSDLQKTLDLRGFTGGGVKVFLDGAPLNEPRNNALALELVSPLALERVEVTRGSGAAHAGGGSEAGVINLWTRGGDSAGGRLGLAAGDFDTVDGSLAGWGRGAETDWFGVGSLYESDGHRDNGDARLGRLSAGGGRRVGGGELRFSVLFGDGEFGNPGALRPDELAVDRRQAPFNELDFSDERTTQATLNYERVFSPELSLRANVFGRDRDRESLTTGRAAPAFGGFLLDVGTRLGGVTAQLSRLAAAHELVAGLDWLDADTEALGFSTPAAHPGEVAPGPASSDNLTSRRGGAVYLQDRWRPSSRLSLSLAGRWDEDQVAYREALPDPSNADRKTYSELSVRGGLTWAMDSAWSLYGSYGEAFLPPTVEELFSFPLFGSNPDLEPEDSRSLELGARHFGARHHAQAVFFRVDTKDEIVFDPGSPRGPFGANVNAGETRREGLELVYRCRPHDGLRWFATMTLLDAEFREGANRGRTVPLAPEHRLSLGIDAELTTGLRLRADALRVGEQVLDNDDANLAPPLDAYTVVNARLTWDPASTTGRSAVPRLFVGARNLLDEEYATRGIYAFDFSTFANSVFLTPAPDRHLTAGLEWGF